MLKWVCALNNNMRKFYRLYPALLFCALCPDVVCILTERQFCHSTCQAAGLSKILSSNKNTACFVHILQLGLIRVVLVFTVFIWKDLVVVVVVGFFFPDISLITVFSIYYPFIPSYWFTLFFFYILFVSCLWISSRFMLWMLMFHLAG